MNEIKLGPRETILLRMMEAMETFENKGVMSRPRRVSIPDCLVRHGHLYVDLHLFQNPLVVYVGMQHPDFKHSYRSFYHNPFATTEEYVEMLSRVEEAFLLVMMVYMNGKQLACWCPPNQDCFCHAAVLLDQFDYLVRFRRAAGVSQKRKPFPFQTIVQKTPVVILSDFMQYLRGANHEKDLSQFSMFQENALCIRCTVNTVAFHVIQRLHCWLERLNQLDQYIPLF